MIIGIGGYGYTGSTAVYDLLKEYDEVDYIKTNRTLEFSFVYNLSYILLPNESEPCAMP